MGYGQYSIDGPAERKSRSQLTHKPKKDRVKEVHTDQMVAHLWAHGTQDHARVQGGRFYFTGAVIYSYGSHFPIARRIARKNGVKVFLFTKRDYSVTTSGHKNTVRRAIPDEVPTIFVHNVPDWEYAEPPADNSHWLRKERELAIREAQGYVDKLKSAKGAALSYALQARECIAQFNELCDCMRAKKLRIKKQLVTDEQVEAARQKSAAAALVQDRVRARRDERDKARDAERARRQAERDQELAAKRDEREAGWLAGDDVRLVHHIDFQDGVRFRIKDGELQTSQGMELPIRDALVYLERIRRVVKNFDPDAGTRPESIEAGHSSWGVIRVRITGDPELATVTIGCHEFKYAEVERIAALYEASPPAELAGEVDHHQS